MSTEDKMMLDEIKDPESSDQLTEEQQKKLSSFGMSLLSETIEQKTLERYKSTEPCFITYRARHHQ